MQISHETFKPDALHDTMVPRFSELLRPEIDELFTKLGFPHFGFRTLDSPSEELHEKFGTATDQLTELEKKQFGEFGFYHKKGVGFVCWDPVDITKLLSFETYFDPNGDLVDFSARDITLFIPSIHGTRKLSDIF